MEYLLYDTKAEAETRLREIDTKLGLLIEDHKTGEFNRPFSSKYSLNIRELTDGRYAIEFALNASAMNTSKLLPNGKVLLKKDIIKNIEEKNLRSRKSLIADGLLSEANSNGFSDEDNANLYYQNGDVYKGGTFGEIHVHDNSTAQSIPVGATYTKSTAFINNGFSNNATPDHVNDKITITKTGIYRVEGET